MEDSIQVTREDGTTKEIVGVDRDDWDGLSDPCPVCGSCEFDHFATTGGHFGRQGTAVIERTDYWDAKRQLFTRCRGCDEVLYKHPAFDLLFEYSGNCPAE